MRTGEQHQFYDYSPIVDRPPLSWPEGARIALWVVLNIGHYELVASDGRTDVPQMSRRDYGNRVGVWRIMDLLDRHGIRGTVALNSAVCRHYPRVIEACLARHWELMGHGITNSQLQLGLSEEDERALIFGAMDEIVSCGKFPLSTTSARAGGASAFASAPDGATGSGSLRTPISAG